MADRVRWARCFCSTSALWAFIEVAEEVVEGDTHGHASAVLAASIFHFGTFTIGWTGYLGIFATMIVIALLTTLTARFTVMRTIDEIDL